jgi:hypothetical protein
MGNSMRRLKCSKERMDAMDNDVVVAVVGDGKQ